MTTTARTDLLQLLADCGLTQRIGSEAYADPILTKHANELLPDWEAMYEPGNVSDYLIGYANSEAAAKGAAEAWLRSEKQDVGRLEWVPDPLMAVREHDQWFELIEHQDDIGTTGTGINVRHRAEEQPAAKDPLAEVLGIVLAYVIESNDSGGIDANDLMHRLERAGYPLPDDEDGS